MATDNRDDFSARTKQTIATRAGWLCSLPECRCLTAGPSEETPSKTASIGVAAHICAAAPGGRRFDRAMTAAERSHIENAIWLCATHATLIDRDEHRYSVEYLREVKAKHESWTADRLLRGGGGVPRVDDLVAVGPDIVCVGELLGVAGLEWKVRVRHFVVGNLSTLTSFVENFWRISPNDRFILINDLGDGRELAESPSFSNEADGYVILCPVAAAFPRISAHEMPADFDFGRRGDLALTESGDIATVSGLTAVPQRLWSCLSMQRGESPFNRDFGSRLSFYCKAFAGTPWLTGLLKLEVIKQAAVPYRDDVLGYRHTPLMCVEQVREVEALAPKAEDQRLPLKLSLGLKGVKETWTTDVAVFVPEPSDSHPPWTVEGDQILLRDQDQ